jgi:hypothetical protein
MPKLMNVHNNIVLELNLIRNKCFDVKEGRADFENWIPFEFVFSIDEKEVYTYQEEQEATFSLEDISRMLSGFESIIKEKLEKRELKSFSWGPIENYFSLNIYETFEENEINIELWIVVGELTQGKSYGYSRGFRFVISIDALNSFAMELKEQLVQILE